MKQNKTPEHQRGILAITEKSYNIVFNFLNIALRMNFLCKLPQYGKYLINNKDFKDIHKGETCYILGNGPSLNDMELSKIKGKHIFVTNLLFFSPIFDLISPEYYFALDENTFSMYSNELEQIIKQNPEMNFFVSRKAKKYLKISENIHLLYPSWIPTSSKIYNNIALGKLNSFMNIIHFAIVVAAYMGFKKIYLLGCDFTLTHVAPKHCYKKEKDVSVFQKMHPYRYLGSAIAFRQHMYIAEWADRIGLEIYNATPNSMLDMYPMVDYSEIK